MAKLVISAQNKVGQEIPANKVLAIYKNATDGSFFTGNKGYDSVVQAIRANESAVGAIGVDTWLEIAKSGGIDAINDALSEFTG